MQNIANNANANANATSGGEEEEEGVYGRVSASLASKVQFISIDIDDSESQEEVFMGKFGCLSIPQYIYMSGEREVSRSKGEGGKEGLQKQLRQLLEFKK